MNNYQFTTNLPQEPTNNPEDGFTDFMEAIGKNGNINRENIIQMLEEDNADINAQNAQGYTAINLIAIRGSVPNYPVLDILELIYKHSKERIDVNLPDMNGNTPLMNAVNFEGLLEYELVFVLNFCYLLKYLGQIPLIDNFNTEWFADYPLTQPGVVRINQPDANIQIKNNNGETAWSLIQNNYQKLDNENALLDKKLMRIKQFTYSVLKYFEPLLTPPEEPTYIADFKHIEDVEEEDESFTDLMKITSLESVCHAYHGGEVKIKALYSRIKRLVKESPDINAQTTNGSTVINLVAKRLGKLKKIVNSDGSIDYIRYLAGDVIVNIFRHSTQIIDINLPDNQGNTPLLSCLNLVESRRISPDPRIMSGTFTLLIIFVHFLVQWEGGELFKNNKIVQPLSKVVIKNNKNLNSFDLVGLMKEKLFYDYGYNRLEIKELTNIASVLSIGEVPKNIREMSLSISSETEIFDPITLENEKLHKIIKNAETPIIIFTDEKMKNFAIAEKSKIRSVTTGGQEYDGIGKYVNLEAFELIKYGCKAPTTALHITKDMVSINEPFIQINKFGLSGTATDSLLRKNYLAFVNYNSKENDVFMVIKDPSYNKISPLVDANVIFWRENAPGHRVNIANEVIDVVSGNHCQPGSSGFISYLVPVKVVTPESLKRGGRKTKINKKNKKFNRTKRKK